MLEFSRNSVSICGFSVRYYGMLIALGVFLGVLLAGRREKKLGLKKDTTLDIAIICVPFSIVCARIYYVIFEWETYADNFMSVFDLRNGGLAIYGGVIGGVLAGFIYSRVKKVGFAKLADMAAPSLALGQAIGRWGNFLNEEAYGVELVNPALHFFPAGVFISSDGLWHAATFFYESIWCLGIVIFILAAERRRFFKREGDMLLWYAFLYALERAAVEGLRLDSLYWGQVRVSQALSLCVVFIAALVFSMRGRGKLLLRILAPVACLITPILIMTGVVGCFTPAAFVLYFLEGGLTMAMYASGENHGRNY